MPQPVTLEQIFGGFVRQETLEDAAQEMASFARSDAQFFREVSAALTEAIASGSDQDLSVLTAVHGSGYRVADAAEARQYCSDLLDMFRAQVANGP